jgi:group I intron endonuclease
MKMLSSPPDFCNQKKQILAKNKGKAGVYCWTNIQSEKSYIGSSVDLTRRFREYYNPYHLRTRSKSSVICGEAALLNKKHSAFKLEILEYCGVGLGAKQGFAPPHPTPSDVLKREQYFLDLLKPEYNVLITAGSPLGYKHTEENKGKMSAAALGHKCSESSRAKMSASALGRVHLEDAKLSMVAAWRGKDKETRE